MTIVTLHPKMSYEIPAHVKTVQIGNTGASAGKYLLISPEGSKEQNINAGETVTVSIPSSPANIANMGETALDLRL